MSRTRRRVLVGAATLVVLALVAILGVAWYFSSLALDVPHTVEYPETVVAETSGPDLHVVISRDTYSQVAGVYGLKWAGGYGEVGPVLSTTATTVTRAYTPVRGTPAVGTPVWVDEFRYDGDPSGLGLGFDEVTLHSDAGALPTWVVPAGGGAAAQSGRTWVVLLHGRGGSRPEELRYLPSLHAAGYPLVVPTYRADVGAAASPDGHGNLGNTEWRDADAAVAYALAHGARDVVLFGDSMGGAIALQTADRAPDRSHIRGLLLDSPVVDWTDVFDQQGAERGLPAPMTWLALQVLQLRSGIDLGRLDWVARARDLRVPVLLVHSDSDTYVSDRPAKELAAARPDLVTLVLVPGAEHTRAWNVDPMQYETRMLTWLRAHGATGGPGA